MYILVNNTWQDGYLDQTLLAHSVRIKTAVWFNLNPLSGLYFIPPKSWRLILNYIKEIGVLSVLQKVMSRLNEKTRNEKYLSLGIGTVIESKSTLFKENDYVIFLAPCHPRCMERIVVTDQLVDFCHSPLFIQSISAPLAHSDISKTITLPSDFSNYGGWTEYAGISLPEGIKNHIQAIFSLILNQIPHLIFNRFAHCSRISEKSTASPAIPANWLPWVLCSTSQAQEAGGRRAIVRNNTQGNQLAGIAAASPPHYSKKLKVCLFGYGQYAKTIILPNIKKSVDIAYIHEIDPTQLPTKKSKFITYDTSPTIRPETACDIYFIAGYHHTHARLAIEAMRTGKIAVIEKPIITHQHDLKLLIDAMRQYQTPLFACYQKRYHIFNKWIADDLTIKAEEPISYHCVVFEVPLPERHWYRWPHSGSRLLSNGCHWVDHFLYLNYYSNVSHFSLQVAKNGDLNIFVELTNQATFSMLLTEKGSARLGLREHIEIRANQKTVAITDGSQYQAEDAYRILRKKRIKRLAAYQNMYRTIIEKIINHESGDSIESVERSNALILSLENLYQEHIRAHTPRLALETQYNC